eukprot:Hpha_TRINITY_DN16433_c2_g3::TRINITY_DN16433_c2_g3_i5::g.162999::m.162999
MPRGGNSWNAFQKSCGGQGMSQAEIREAYHAQGAGGGGGGAGYSSFGDAGAHRMAAVRQEPAPAVASSGNTWHDFRREHAGQGLSPSEMSGAYHAHMAARQEPAPAVASSYKPAPAVASSGNTWHDFRREHAGQGLSPSEMSAKYQAHMVQSASGKQLGGKGAKASAAAQAAAAAEERQARAKNRGETRAAGAGGMPKWERLYEEWYNNGDDKTDLKTVILRCGAGGMLGDKKEGKVREACWVTRRRGRC